MSHSSQTDTFIIAFSDSKHARLLADYLTSSNINVRIVEVQPSNSGNAAAAPLVDGESNAGANVSADQLRYHIIALNEHDLPKASRIAEDFVCNPNQAKYQNAAWQVGSTFSNEAQKLARGSSKLPNWTKDLIGAPFMSTVLLICLSVFILSYLGAFNAVYNALNIRSLDELALTQEWWRLFTPAFIHFSVMHIVFNLIWWWILGSQLERTFGTASLIIIFAFAALSSNVAQLLVSGPNFGGLSGVVYALFGFVWWIGLLRPSWGIGLPNNLVIFLLGWIVVGYLGILGMNMANEAHLIGLVSGCLMALVTHQVATLKNLKKR